MLPEPVPALPNEPSCLAIGLCAMAWVPARYALSMSSQPLSLALLTSITDDRRG
jgi:hypothetical protein